jgi:hypothetical protein
MIEVTAPMAGAAPLPSLQRAHLAARTRDAAKEAPPQAGPSRWTADEPAITAEVPPRWPRVFPGL